MSSPKGEPTSTALVAAYKPTLSLNRQVVLEEDEYTEALSNIIARDFFPSLAHLEATNSYLTALESNDVHLIDASVQRLENLGPTPTRAQFSGETPLRTPRRGEPLMKRKKYDDSLSLDDFQARYTSEDNSSFTEILDEENRKRKERYGWAWDAQKRVSQAKAIEDVQRNRLLIDGAVSDQGVGVRPGQRGLLLIERPEGGDIQLISDKEHSEPENQDNKEQEQSEMALVIVPSQQQDVMAPLKDTRSASVPGWAFKARNSLMFSPDADESPYHPSNIASGSKGDPKVILHSNTRLPSQSEEAEAGPGVPPSPTRSRIDAAIAGTPYHPGPRINGFSFVPSLPSPTPAQLGADAVKQLMTVGTLLGTPRILSGGDDHEPLAPPDTPFRIVPPTQREAVAHRLSNKASRSLRAKAALLSGAPARTPKTKSASGTSMAPPTWTPRRAAGDLTPAAQRLLGRTSTGSLGGLRVKKTPQTKEGGLGIEKDLGKERWTPTPGRRRV